MVAVMARVRMVTARLTELRMARMAARTKARKVMDIRIKARAVVFRR